MKDLYSILGIQRSANDSEIKKAYKKLAFQYHPDKNKELDAQDKFRDISEAYDILTNADKRRMYDNFGYEALEGQNALPINPLDLFQSLFNVDFAGLGEGMQSNIFVFSDLSSGPFLNIQNKMSYNLECSLDELYHGTQKEFEIPHLTSKGRKSTKYIINVKKGSKDGDNIVVKEGGNYIPELNLTEDLVIKVIETPHPKYKRKGNDLIIEEKITLVEALCGVELKIEHLQGPLQVEIKDIVNPNQMFQVFGQGMPHPREYGTFPRVLGRYVRERGLMTLEEAVRKMTGATAKRLGFQDRGLLREGFMADIAVFDPDRITDHATFSEPHQYAEGIEYVVVNGVMVVDGGDHTGARPGRILYGPGRR